jgi:hypothetical protein
MVPPGEETPKAAAFIEWSKVIAGHVAPGAKNERIRGYLKALAKETWELVNWLTHAANAGRYDGMIAVDATLSTIQALGAALLRHERQTIERCGGCGSLRLAQLYNPEIDSDAVVCQSCGWESFPERDTQEA